ncbi:unnamed protein product [Cylicocyclus nassatus]|uniref:Uncharacterized protein n=1 Tax=Cylicocyclus nassatus TaxID=53992 RepID=A0AA36HF35_CYLNA|nr:unnamed protein product [Cylicocyclus nassatus]
MRPSLGFALWKTASLTLLICKLQQSGGNHFLWLTEIFSNPSPRFVNGWSWIWDKLLFMDIIFKDLEFHPISEGFDMICYSAYSQL